MAKYRVKNGIVAMAEVDAYEVKVERDHFVFFDDNSNVGFNSSC